MLMRDQELLANVRLVLFDFDGVFTDNTVYVCEDGRESVRCWRSDGLGLAALRKSGVECMIISTETNPVVAARSKKLKLDCHQAVTDKAEAVIAVCEELKVSAEQTMFVGNDVNDIPAFHVVGIPVAVADAYPAVSPYIRWRTKKPGGYGAVREICDLILEAKYASLPDRNQEMSFE